MTEKEIWKEIEGYEGLYEVSNMGNVRSFATKKLLTLRNEKSRRTIRVNLKKDGKCKYYIVARLVAQAFYPYVLHKNGDYTDNKLENIFYANSMTESFRARVIMTKPMLNPSVVLPRPIKNSKGDIFPTIEKAAEILNIEPSSISRALSNQQRTAGGFVWGYAS